jgi:SAM-dependent methyltransferase
VLDLGRTPLANRVLPPEAVGGPEPTFPLAVVVCEACALAQLTETVPAETMFSEYVYLSGVSDTVVAHMRAHAEQLLADRALGPDSQVVEIASNDGTLLRPFHQAGVPVLGIEPAANIAALCTAEGIPTEVAFFSREVGARLAADGVRADVVLANNVLAHVPDPVGFVAGIAAILDRRGVAELEVPYVVDLIDHVEFDTIYHEHLMYFSVHALVALAARAGLVLTDVRRFPIHGGSLRITLAHRAEPAGVARVHAILADEEARGVHTPAFYAGFGARVRDLGQGLRQTLVELRAAGHRIAAYGASAKGATLLNGFGIDADLIEYVVDRAPTKQGRYTPGSHLPILAPEHLAADAPDFALLLAWNHADEILAQQADYRAAGGRFIVPVPTVRIV